MLRLSKISCVAFGGWVAGITTERFLRLKSEEKIPNVESIFGGSSDGTNSIPVLPIFGTVTAATLIPKSPQDVQPIPDTSRTSTLSNLLLEQTSIPSRHHLPIAKS